MKLAREEILSLRADVDAWKLKTESSANCEDRAKLDQLLTMALDAFDKAVQDDSAWISTANECFKEAQVLADRYGISQRR